MKRAVSKFSRNKFQYGGRTPTSELYKQYYTTDQGKKTTDYQKDKDSLLNTASGVGAAIPGWGGLVSLGIGIAKNADSAAQDEYGVNKGGWNTVGRYAFGTEALDTVFSQQKALTEGNFKDFFGDALSLGTFGLYKSSGQKEAERNRDTFIKQKLSDDTQRMALRGRVERNLNFPDYVAPKYGRAGMKFKTKFAKK